MDGYRGPWEEGVTDERDALIWGLLHALTECLKFHPQRHVAATFHSSRLRVTRRGESRRVDMEKPGRKLQGQFQPGCP